MENLYLLNSRYSLLACLPSVRPPPGFECKQPPNHMSGIDDPSILWSKTLDPGEHFFIHSMIRMANLIISRVRQGTILVFGQNLSEIIP